MRGNPLVEGIVTQDEVYAWVGLLSLAGRLGLVVGIGALMLYAGASWGMAFGYALGAAVGGVVLGRWA